MNAGTAAILVILVGIGLVAIKGTMKRILHGCCGGSGPKMQKVKVEDKNISNYPYQARVSIEGMSCSTCALRVENALNSLDGVWGTVNLGKKEALIRTKEKPDEAKINQAIAGAGYHVTKYCEC